MTHSSSSLGFDIGLSTMYSGSMSETITVTTKALAISAGLPIPTFVNNVADDYIMVYDRDNELVCWGPEAERENVLRLAKVYE